MHKIINTIGSGRDLVSIIYILVLIFTSVSVNYYFGSIGVLPIDSFAFFDSANFINKGYIPIRDYWTSNGFVIDLIQSIFFKMFGVSWNSYLLHSSIVNLFFSLVTFKFLKEEGLGKASAFFYTFSVAILAYPSVGVPFPDHHSLLFSLAGIYFLIFAFKKQNNFFWFLLPIILSIAFLSKQIPSAPIILFVFFYMVCFAIYKKNFSLFIPVIISSGIILVLFFFFLFFNDIKFKNFLIQYILFPLTIGSERIDDNGITNLIFRFLNDFKIFLLLGIILLLQSIQKLKIKKNKLKLIFETNFIFFLLILIITINQILIKNQIIIFFLLPILLGLIQINLNKNLKIKKYIIFFLICLNIFATSKYHQRFNVERKFMELENIDKSKLIDALKISSNLKGLKWETNKNKKRLNDEEVQILLKSIEYLKKNKKNSLIITNYQFILSEIKHNLYPPNRWHTNDGASYPLVKNKYHNFYVDFYKNKLKSYDIDKIFTLKPVDEKDFNFILRKECIKTTQINIILHKHELLNCFEKQ